MTRRRLLMIGRGAIARRTFGLDRRGFLRLSGLRRHGLADAGRASAGRADRAGPRAGAVDHPALAGGRAEPARNLRSPPRYQDRRWDAGDRHRGQGGPAGRGVRPARRGHGRRLARPLDGQQGGGPRARHLPDEDAATGPMRPSSTPRSARSAATSSPRARPRSPGTSRSCRRSGRRAGASSAATTTPSRPTTRSSGCPTSRRSSPAAARRRPHRRPRRRRAGLRPRPHASGSPPRSTWTRSAAPGR